jgi:hypothetical protein
LSRRGKSVPLIADDEFQQIHPGLRRNLWKHLPLCLSSPVVPVSELAIIIAMIPASGLGAVISRKMTKSIITTF